MAVYRFIQGTDKDLDALTIQRRGERLAALESVKHDPRTHYEQRMRSFGDALEEFEHAYGIEWADYEAADD